MKKFKVWDKKEKWFSTVFFYIGQNGKLYYDDGYFLQEAKKSRFIICLETGIKDKTGKMIYEGDLLVTSNDGKNGCDVWDEDENGYTSYLPESLKNKYEFNWHVEEDWNDSIYSKPYIKIVGNIFENPGLLK